MFHIRLGLVSCLALLSACVDGNSTRAIPTRQIAETPETCLSCLSLTSIVFLGDESDGFITNVMYAAVDSHGRYWLSQPTGPKVFDSNGDFIYKVGSAGQGPGEFLDAGPIFLDDSGAIHIIDRGNARETIYRDDFTLLENRSLPGRVQDFVPIPNSSSAVVNAILSSSDLFGEPLHILLGSDIAYSFGLPGSGSATLDLNRRLAVDRNGRIFSSTFDEYAIAVWTQRGEPIETLYRHGLWERVPRQPVTPNSDVPPAAYITSLRVDDQNRLWMVAWLPRPDWKEGLEEVQMPDGSLGFQPRGGATESVMYSVVEVVDLATATILARGEFDVLPGGFLSDNLIYGMVQDSVGAPKVAIWRLDYTSQRGDSDD